MPRLTKEERAAKRIADKATADQMHAAREEVRRVVASGKCPRCSRPLRRNLSMTGWWQCSQLGAEGFRADPSQPSCDWQGFTE